MQSCVTAAKIILTHDGKPRRSKYEKANYLRIDFSKTGKVTIYATFPKEMGLKGRKLGSYPELQLPIAREKAQEIARDGLRAESVAQAISMYEDDLRGRVARQSMSEASFDTYSARIKQLRLAFDERLVFADVSYNQLIDVVNTWIATKSNNHALELFAELRRVWRFCAPLLANGKNVAASIPDDYVSSRVQRPLPTRLYTDIGSMARLWLNLASCTSQHQKNAVRYMILTGVRPINVCNLKWEYIDEAMSEIVYPAAVIGLRGAMKTQGEFRLPITEPLKQILEEQREWQHAVPACNKEYVFLKVSDLSQPFSKRTLDKLIKRHMPENAIKGITHDGTVKGSAGAFNTICRKFLKTNIIVLLRGKGLSRSEVREISALCMHHKIDRDPMAEHYDFSDEILQEEMALKRVAFQAHAESILENAALLRRKL
ncbi:recombinase [Salinivibrio kushneri]|nr:recombinase [Salinivibrio kushneri]